MNLRSFWPLTLLVAAALPPGADAATTSGLTLVQDGRPTAVIAVPAPPAPAAFAAARELQEYLRKATGATVPIKPEDALTAAERDGVLVLVGEGQLARQAGVRVAALEPEGFLIKTTGKRLLLAGREDALGGGERQQGTSFAVIAFLEQELGVRWLWPGPLGEVVPHRATLTIPALDRVDAPRLQQRKLRDAMVNPNPAKWARGRSLMGMDEARHAQMAEQSHAWLRRQRMGRSIEINAQHGFHGWWEEYHEKHPEYFALQLNGSRVWPTELGGYDRVKMCVSSPGLLDQFMQNATAFFHEHPEATSFSASPNDNAYNGHCTCPNCQAWDAAAAPKVTLMSVGKDGKRVSYEYPALTDRYVHFYNLAAERLAKVAPGKLIGGYAYGAWRTPPVREKLRENIVVGFVGLGYLDDAGEAADRRSWDGWAKAAHHLFLRPNLLHAGHGYPLVYAHRLGEDLRHCAQTGMMGADFDSLTHHWASQGLNYYVLAKLMWNPAADVDALEEDYCRSGFGPAAPAVRAYFDALERHTRALAARGPGGKNKDFVAEALPLHTPPHFAALQAHLDRAKALAAADTTVRERIRFLEKGLEYARLQSEAARQVQAAKGADTPAARQAIAARQQFYHDNLYSFAINVPDLVQNEARGKAGIASGGRANERERRKVKDEEG